ncbi:ATP-binding protein [Jatrophihabitans endophyticus]|uniref:sensor histidine kinase n=1 Tax=Jatrophihabitans endophyticus TaxID=1206085 RepID=UPI0019F57FCE|nr:ATP-binding protein [Jatrophihabitans endophyticus]MBE7187155.1 sensor histidine kinase KdpD [Jatrophihabitans endophyticus]
MSRRGRLRVYLGAAPGVGKTYAMLDEGHRRAERGTDVVVGVVETHGRAHTAARLDGLEVVSRTDVAYRGTVLTELDLPAVLARRPDVALIDEMAHTNAPGLTHQKRWQDIEELLEAGIDVISTVNVQHLESLNDVVQAITGAPQRETVPDSVVRAAEQVELVDMTPEALRRRMAHGNIYRPDRVDAALSNYFRPGNLTALRELALLWLADSVEEGLRRYREQHGIDTTWETRERVVVALTGGPEGETLLRRGARIAARAGSGELMALHVARSDGLAGSSIAALEKQRLLAESLGGSYHSVAGDDVAESVLDFARGHHATQIVIGASRRHPVVAGLTGPGTGMSITRASGPIDVHVVSHDYVGRGRVLPRLRSGVTVRRRVAGVVVSSVLLVALTVGCALSRPALGLPSEMLLFLFVVVLASLIGGFSPAVATAVAASLLINYYFVPPLHTFTIGAPENILAVVIFVVVAVLVSRVVDIAARRSSEAARSNAEAETLSTLAGSLLRGEQSLPALLQRVQETFAVRSVSLLRRRSDAPGSSAEAGRNTASGLRGSWDVLASVGIHPCRRPEDSDTEVAVGDDLLLVLCGRVLAAEDRRMLSAFAAQVAVAYRQRRLAEVAASAGPLAETDRTRTALLNAVSHDLRTPIATAKASVTSLRTKDIAWTEADRDELLAGADDALDRLTDLVGNLLDLSRVQAGVLAVSATPVDLEDVVSRALDHVLPAAAASGAPSPVDTDLTGTALPEVVADGGLLERVVANLVENALRHSPPGRSVRVAASAHHDTVELRIIDVGRGIAVEDRAAVFEPFQRLDDHPSATGAGVGLGLAISRSFVEAMRGTLELEDTPGGGLTAVVALPAAAPATGPSAETVTTEEAWS